jgi:flagellar biosynthesis protein FlhF
MELKRILARDTRTATEKAIALYGHDVLIVANQRVGGQTELVLAIDIAPEEVKVDAAVSAAPAGKFQNQLDALLRPHATGALAGAEHIAINKKIAAAIQPATAEQDDRDRLRSQELVAMVREELADLRREFRLSQQAMPWQDMLPVDEAVKPLIQALSVSGAPVMLRTLLLDGLRDQTDLRTARQQMQKQLTHAISREPSEAPRHGVHVLAGASGSGKTLMAARLAKQAVQDMGSEQVALISYRDMRAGAWSQMQILGSQAGVETFRATDSATLAVLLAEMSHRQLVLIDTAGVEMDKHLQDIRSVCPQAQLHAVVCADASETSLRRVLAQADLRFASVMLSKIDESGIPWALLQFLCNESHVPAFSVVSRSDRINEPLMPITAQEFVDHVMNLSGLNTLAAEPVAPFNAVPRMTGWMSGSAHA